jgi:hypothetical protein
VHISTQHILKFAFAVAVPVILSACATHHVMQPFSTDGCSMFPDRSLVSSADWCACCVAHDWAYWRGGSAEERLKADQELKRCVQAASGNQALAGLMFAGVRAGGGPNFFTPYRWGYGWSFGRSYQPLSELEAAQASSLRAKYIADPPASVCTGNATLAIRLSQ